MLHITSSLNPKNARSKKNAKRSKPKLLTLNRKSGHSLRSVTNFKQSLTDLIQRATSLSTRQAAMFKVKSKEITSARPAAMFRVKSLRITSARQAAMFRVTTLRIIRANPGMQIRTQIRTHTMPTSQADKTEDGTETPIIGRGNNDKKESKTKMI